MTLFIAPSPNIPATAPVPRLAARDGVRAVRATVDWAGHVAAGRMGPGDPPPTVPAAGTDTRFASLAAILGTGRAGR